MKSFWNPPCTRKFHSAALKFAGFVTLNSSLIGNTKVLARKSALSKGR